MSVYKGVCSHAIWLFHLITLNVSNKFDPIQTSLNRLSYSQTLGFDQHYMYMVGINSLAETVTHKPSSNANDARCCDLRRCSIVIAKTQRHSSCAAVYVFIYHYTASVVPNCLICSFHHIDSLALRFAFRILWRPGAPKIEYAFIVGIICALLCAFRST